MSEAPSLFDRQIEPIRIDRAALYTDKNLRLLLGVSQGMLNAARKRGELKFSKIGRLYLHRGTWVWHWLTPTPRPPVTSPTVS